jgi:hypothetical protein
MLGFCGKEEDLPRLEAYLKECAAQSELSISECGAMSAVPSAVAFMHRRRVEGAKEKLEEMLSLSYWTKLEVQSFPTLSARVPSASWELTACAVRATAQVSAQYAQQSIDKSLALEENAEIQAFLKHRFADNTLSDVSSAFEKRIERPRNSETARFLAIRSNGDLDNPMPNPQYSEQARAISAETGKAAQSSVKELSKREVEDVKEEAKRDYAAILEAVSVGDFKTALPRVFDRRSGVPRGPAADETQHVIDGFKELQPLVAEVKGRKITPEALTVDRQFLRENNKEVEVIKVSAELPGTEDLAKKLTGGGARRAVSSKTGCLLVIMRKTGGKWFWHPFGW